jgi:hypothetical protein
MSETRNANDYTLIKDTGATVNNLIACLKPQLDFSFENYIHVCCFFRGR